MSIFRHNPGHSRSMDGVASARLRAVIHIFLAEPMPAKDVDARNKLGALKVCCGTINLNGLCFNACQKASASLQDSLPLFRYPYRTKAARYQPLRYRFHELPI